MSLRPDGCIGPQVARPVIYACSMRPTPDVSIVIVNWNTRQYLLECIESLISQTSRTSIEIIVVDNASEDGSQDALGQTYPQVKLIQNSENLGFAKANNIGFAVASGSAFCLVNTDVIALGGVVDKLWDYLSTHPTVGMVGPRTINRDSETRLNVRRFPSITNAVGDYFWLRRLPFIGVPGRALPKSTYCQTHDAEVLSGCFLMVRRDAVDEVGALDEDFFFYGEDTDWCKRFSDSGWGIVYHPEAEAVHYGGGSSAAYPVKYYLTMEQADLRYWRKHHSPRAVAVYLAIKVTHHLVSLGVWLARWLAQPSRRAQASLKIRGHATNLVWVISRRNLVHRLA